MHETPLVCWRCGEPLRGDLPRVFPRREQCRACGGDLHVCRMCVHYDRNVARQCREDGAEDVTEKERPNFCEWFKPSSKAFDPARKSEADAAKAALDALFGGGDDR